MADQDDINLVDDGVTDAPESAEPEHVGDAVREAFAQAKEKAEAGDDPEKLEQIRVRRAKDGRFDRREGDDTQKAAKAAQTPSEAQEKPAAEKPAVPSEKDPQASDGPLVLKPPVGWSPQARADFAKLPPHIQQAVAQREREVNNGFAKLAEYKGMDEHMPLIKASGLTAAQFTKNAVEWERSLKQNPVTTIMHAARVGGVDMVKLSQEILRRQGGQPAAIQPGAQRQPAAIQPNVSQLVQQEFAKREFAAKQATASQTAEQFLADPANIHAEAVVDDMVALIRSGRAKDLPAAYEMACWARPDIRPLMIKSQGQPSNGTIRARAADQARAAAKATTGAPSGRPAATRSAVPSTVRDAVRQAYEAQLDNA